MSFPPSAKLGGAKSIEWLWTAASGLSMYFMRGWACQNGLMKILNDDAAEVA